MKSPLAPAPARPIRTAIVGYGLSGKVFHGPFVRADDNFVVSAIVTSNGVRQAEARGDHPDARVFSTFDLLHDSDEEIDLVILSSPPDTHVDFALRSLAAGAAVIIDKPFAPTVMDARSLTVAAQVAGRPLMVFHNRRWDGDFLTVQRLIAEGELGDVFAFESSFEHWAPRATSGWKDQLSALNGGGVAFDLGSHLVDQALALFGPVAHVASSLRTVRTGGGNDDHARIDLRHEGGVETRLLMSRVSRGLGPRFRVLGTNGSFTSAGLDGQEPALAAGVVPNDPQYGVTPPSGYGTLEAEGPSGIVSRRIPMERGDYPEFYRRAARAVRGEGAAPVSIDDATAVVDILERARLLNLA